MSVKVPLTARIRPDLAVQIEHMQAKGKSKTEILEKALDLYFENNVQDQGVITPDLIRSIFREEIQSLRCDTSVIQENCDKIQMARELVDLVNEIRVRESCSIKKACKLAGFSDKKYYNMLHKIPKV